MARNPPAPDAPGGVSKRTSNADASTGPDLAQQIGQNGVAAGVAEIATVRDAGDGRSIAETPPDARADRARKPAAGISAVGVDRRPAAPALVRCIDALSCGRGHSARDGRDADALAMQFKDHDDLPKSDQRRIPQSRKGTSSLIRTDCFARILRLRPSAHLGNFQPAQVGIIRPALTLGRPRRLRTS